MALAFSIGFAMQTTPGSAQDQQQPPAEAEQAAPADAGAADTMPAAEQPEQHDGAATHEAAPAEPASPEGGAAEAQPAQPEAPAAAESTEAPAATAAVPASDLKIGAAVYGADGAKIGEVNGVKSDGTGKVQEILVTDGVAASMNAKVFAISADKITSVSDGVKLSLSSEEAKKLPIIDNSNG